MSYQKLVAFTVVSLSLAMTACQKNDAPATTASTPKPTASVTTPANPTNPTASSTATATSTANIPKLSPAMQFWVETNQGLINKMINESYPNLTEQQKLCLKSVEGWNNYVSILKPYTEKVLTPAEIAEADKFYGSTTGMMFTTAMKQQLGIMDPNMPPMPLDAAQKKEITEALKKPFMAKMQAATDKMSQEEGLAFAKSMADLEIKRCNIQ